MEEYLELLAKAQATRNAQIIHTKCPTMMNNFIKIVYEVSFDKLLRDKTALVKAAGHKVEFSKNLG